VHPDPYRNSPRTSMRVPEATWIPGNRTACRIPRSEPNLDRNLAKARGDIGPFLEVGRIKRRIIPDPVSEVRG
jgi:hypothetical protein